MGYFPFLKVSRYGSTVTGLMLPDSDVDLSVSGDDIGVKLLHEMAQKF